MFWKLGPSPTAIIEMTNNMILEAFFYNRNTSLSCFDDFVGPKVHNASNNSKSTVWHPPLAGWFRWSTNSSRVKKKKSKTISYMCRNKIRSIFFAFNKKIGDHNVLLTEALTIREAIVNATRKQMKQVVIESDFFVIVKAINWEINYPWLIANIVEDIKMLTKALGYKI